MKILYLAPCQPFPAPHAGFTHTYNMTKNLQALGHDIHVVARYTKKTDIGCCIEYDNLPVYYVDWSIHSLPKFINSFVHTLKVIDDVDIIHERFEVPGGAGIIYSKMFNIPSILEVNDPFLDKQPTKNLPQKIRGFMMGGNRSWQLRSFSGIVTQTRILKNIISKETNVPIEIVPNGVNPSFFNPDVKSVYTSDKKVIGFVGAFEKWHGVNDLIDAFKIVRKKENVKLLLIGGERKKIIGDIVFTGPIPYKEMPGYLASCNILVAPFNPMSDEKKKEIFQKYGMWWSPLKIFEYMAVGKPVVTSNVGVIPEYVEDAGLIYKAGDIKDLASKILLLLDDDKLAERLGRCSREKVVESYTWESQAKKMIEFYKKTLNMFK
ncbi:MAG: glycosyltransferase family 4 protein [Thermoplasmatales archaeon]|nr:glycosyltransferase family 4 protein [Thermoplasmatales archaeon]